MNLVREPDAGNPPVRFDEREVETEHGMRLLRHKRGNPDPEYVEAYPTAPPLDSTLPAAKGGQSHFRGGQALSEANVPRPQKSGQSPVNNYLDGRKLLRLESFLMPANFSSIVGEFMSTAIPKYCRSLAKNTYHNGHPDLVPAGRYERDACQHGLEGVEIKGSRHLSGWQGHNAEDTCASSVRFRRQQP